MANNSCPTLLGGHRRGQRVRHKTGRNMLYQIYSPCLMHNGSRLHEITMGHHVHHSKGSTMIIVINITILIADSRRPCRRGPIRKESLAEWYGQKNAEREMDIFLKKFIVEPEMQITQKTRRGHTIIIIISHNRDTQTLNSMAILCPRSCPALMMSCAGY